MSNQNQKRGRHRNGGGNNNSGRRGNPARQNFDSNGPNVRIRGNATQVYEKYIQLARDAQQASDRVLAENLLQHAEHYYRILNVDQNDRQPGRNAGDPRNANRGQQPGDNAGGNGSGGNNADGNGADQDAQTDESEFAARSDDESNVPQDGNAQDGESADSENASTRARRAPAKRGRGRGRPPRRHQAASDDQGDTAVDGNASGSGSSESPDSNGPREAVGAD